MTPAQALAIEHGLTRSDVADLDADLRAQREHDARAAMDDRRGCADLTDRPDDLCTTCWTDHGTGSHAS